MFTKQQLVMEGKDTVWNQAAEDLINQDLCKNDEVMGWWIQ